MGYLQDLLETVQFHDNHEPDPLGRPQKWQNCAKVEPRTAGTDNEVVYCGKCFRKPLVPPGSEHIAEDPRRDAGGRNKCFSRTRRGGLAWVRWARPSFSVRESVFRPPRRLAF